MLTGENNPAKRVILCFIWFPCVSLFRDACLNFSFTRGEQSPRGLVPSNSARVGRQTVTNRVTNNVGASAWENREHHALVWEGSGKREALQILTGSNYLFGILQSACDFYTRLSHSTKKNKRPSYQKEQPSPRIMTTLPGVLWCA